MAKNQKNADVKANTIIIVSQPDAPNTVRNFSTICMSLGQGTKHLIASEMYGIVGSVIPETSVMHGKRETSRPLVCFWNLGIEVNFVDFMRVILFL